MGTTWTTSRKRTSSLLVARGWLGNFFSGDEGDDDNNRGGGGGEEEEEEEEEEKNEEKSPATNEESNVNEATKATRKEEKALPNLDASTALADLELLLGPDEKNWKRNAKRKKRRRNI